MLFNSFSFLIFAAVVFISVPFLPTRSRVYALIAFSYVFYSMSYPPWVLLLVVCSFVDFSLARYIDKSQSTKRRIILTILSVAVNLTLLIFYKYAEFFAYNINSLTEILGFAFRLPVVS